MIDLTGLVFGRLTVIARAENSRTGQARWRCQCACGSETTSFGANLRRGHSTSCGCVRAEKLSLDPPRLRHGHSSDGVQSRTYRSWAAMVNRCKNPKSDYYEIYGGRGISVCDRWRESFAHFLEDMGERPPGRTIDRKDVNGNYEPGNCRWATNHEQALNRRPRARKSPAADSAKAC